MKHYCQVVVDTEIWFNHIRDGSPALVHIYIIDNDDLCMRAFWVVAFGCMCVFFSNQRERAPWFPEGDGATNIAHIICNEPPQTICICTERK